MIARAVLLLLFCGTCMAFVLWILATGPLLAQAHVKAREPTGIRTVHRVDHARRATWGCQARLGVQRTRSVFSERRSRHTAYRQWVARLWERRAARACGRLRAVIRARNSYIGRLITIATIIGQEAKRNGYPDPWPNCPDPIFQPGSSWQDTKNCESRGYSWYDRRPGGYFCTALQFDPAHWLGLMAKHGVYC